MKSEEVLLCFSMKTRIPLDRKGVIDWHFRSMEILSGEITHRVSAIFIQTQGQVKLDGRLAVGTGRLGGSRFVRWWPARRERRSRKGSVWSRGKKVVSRFLPLS